MRVRRQQTRIPDREAELCELFASRAREQNWIVHPEVAGWDLVLVYAGPAIHFGERRLSPGDQIGIEAKLRASCEVLAQTHRRASSRGPDFRGILVPDASEDFHYVADRLRIDVYTLKHCGPWRRKKRGYLSSQLPIEPFWRWERRSRLWLPPIPLQGSGGHPSPRALTKWRVGALRLCALLRSRGWLTSEDFKRERVSMQRWRDQNRWLRPLRDASGAPAKEGKLVKYGPGIEPLPDVGYEAERDALTNLSA